MEYWYFHALEFVKVNNRLTERNVLEIVLMFGAKMGDLLSVFAVAPHAGAWVEIVSWGYMLLSLYVAPHAGAWVEILIQPDARHTRVRRSPRGSVG